MPTIRSVVLASLLASSLAAAPSLARAADFYQGKVITIIVGFTPGGGYDLRARTLARFIPDHIPGHPTVIVQYMPGAGSLVAARALDMTQPRDGTVMATVDNGLVTESVVKPEFVGVDFRKYAWVGIMAPAFKVCYGFGPDGVKSWDDLMHRKEFVLGSEGKGAGNYINGATLREVFGAPIKQVLGFPGSNEQRLAVERGELDGDCSELSNVRSDWLTENLVHPFVRFTRERVPEVPESAIFIGDLATTQEQKDLLDLLDVGYEVGWSYLMSGDVPSDRIAILNRAFDNTMKDPTFLAETQKQRIPVYPMTGEQATQIVGRISASSPDIIATAKKIYE